MDVNKRQKNKILEHFFVFMGATTNLNETSIIFERDLNSKLTVFVLCFSVYVLHVFCCITIVNCSNISAK